ncbi:hypothetical protein [Silvibacterium acidisoli]|uniref:hypothetical protein n=1 Tax=Acidobacteriaceae bacterium ZG23-2 TaxID=2883246 RepID=UPI00406CE3DA
MTVRFFQTFLVPPAAAALLIAAAGCRSAYVETTLENNGPQAVSIVEVDYPSASFGVQTLAPHSSYHYHFKVQGSGPLTISFTTLDKKIHNGTGPELAEGQHGELRITVQPDYSVTWDKNLSLPR